MDNCEHTVCDKAVETDQIILNLDGQETKKKKPIWPIVVSVVVLVALILVVAFWNSIAGLFIKEAELKTIQDFETQAFDEFSQQVISSYSTVVSSSPSGSKCHLEFEINEFALKMIKKSMPELGTLGVLNDIKLDFVLEKNETKTRLLLAPDHVDADIPDLELQFDSASRHLFVILFGLTDNYLDIDLEEVSENSDVLDGFTSLSQLPTEEVFGALVHEYFDQLVALMEQQSVEQQKVALGEIETDCTVYTARISAEKFDRLNSATVDKLINLIGQNQQASDSLLALVEQLKTEVSSENDYILWETFVDRDGRIIGRKITIGENTILNHLLITYQDQFAVSFSWDSVELFGEGTVENELINGEVTLSVQGKEYLDVKLNDIMTNQLADGIINGALTLDFSDEFVQHLLGMELGLPVSLDVDFSVQEKSAKFNISYMDMVSVSVDTSSYVPDEFALPTGESIDASDTNALRRWLESMDMDKLKEELEKVGLTDLFS